MRGSEEGCLAIDGLCTVDFVNGQCRRRGWYKYRTVLRIGLVLDQFLICCTSTLRHRVRLVCR